MKWGVFPQLGELRELVMSEHPNVEITRRGFELFAAGDIGAITDLLDDDVVWHHPGNSPLAGDHKGKEGVLGFFGTIIQETGGTFKNEVHDILGNDAHVVAMSRITAERNGKVLDQNVINVFHVNKDGKLTERWILSEDPQAFDNFWS